MADKVMTIDKQELKKLYDNLSTLAKGLDEKETRKALVSGGKIFSASAKTKVPVSKSQHSFTRKGKTMTFAPGNLKRSIRILRKNKKLPGLVFVGPKTSKKNTGHFEGKTVNGFYGHWVEYGTQGRKKKWAFTPTKGKIEPQPYMRPAYEESKTSAVQASLKEAEKLLMKKVKTV